MKKTLVAAGAMVIAAACMLVSCNSLAKDARTAEVAAIKPVAVYSADVVICGAGISGLSASVQAAENGLKVITLEKSGILGGGGIGTEGVFAVNSEMQRAQGIDVNPVDVIKREVEYNHNRVDTLRWVDLVNASGDNISWLVKNGVHFTGKVNDYMGGGLMTFHWFGKDRARADYVPPMTAKAKEMGVEFKLNTPAETLIVDNGVVTGVCAKNKAGQYEQYNAKAVILATGGFASNKDDLKAQGYNLDTLVQFLKGFDGDGLRMALQAGGVDNLHNASALNMLSITGGPGGFHGTFGNGNGNGLVAAPHSPNTLWVNQTGERFCAENPGDANWTTMIAPSLEQKSTYSIFDKAIFETNLKSNPGLTESVESNLAALEKRVAENPHNDTFKAKTIEELAEKASAAFPSIDKKKMIVSFNEYNAMAKRGEDTVFGKPSKHLVELKNPPYYFVHMPQAVLVTFGGIHTDRKFEVLNGKDKAIPGLYAIGVDSVELWPNLYTINVPGGCNANNINSGRVAANQAVLYIKK